MPIIAWVEGVSCGHSLCFLRVGLKGFHCEPGLVKDPVERYSEKWEWNE